MGKQYNGRWQSRSHYEFWAECHGQWLAKNTVEGSEYDKDTDAPARIWLAYWICGTNLDTAATCLLNLWCRGDHVDAWDHAIEWLKARVDYDNVNRFEDEAIAFLEDLEKQLGSPRQAVKADAQERDYALEAGGPKLPKVLGDEA
jgi:hypothetical protein